MTPELDKLKSTVEVALSKTLPTSSPIAQPVVDAMRHSVLGGGKRLRPLLVCATSEALGHNVKSALPAACAVEFIHAYSLIHDDLPAMDDDELRHGLPSAHVKYGEANAILAGDSLHSLAFQTIAESDLTRPSARSVSQMIEALGKCCWLGWAWPAVSAWT